MIEVFQIAAACGWLVPVWVFRASLGRFIARRAARFDTVRAAVALTGLTSLAFPVRWLLSSAPLAYVSPDQVALWCGLYVLAMVVSQLLTWATWEATR